MSGINSVKNYRYFILVRKIKKLENFKNCKRVRSDPH